MSFVCCGYLGVVPSRSLYQGVDREPWGCIEEHDALGTLPSELRSAYRSIASVTRRGFWFPITSDLALARWFATYAAAHGGLDLLAVWSPYLKSIHGEFEVASGALPLGWDVVAVGEWSLLGALGPQRQASVIELNAHGLLPSPVEGPRVEKLYRELAARGVVEEIAAPNQLPVEAVYVMRVTEESKR